MSGELMDAEKRKRLEAAGWRTGDFADFLGLTDEERAIVESRLEHQRLEREVTSVARRWAKAGAGDAHAQIAADNELRDAVTNLEAFEAEQK